MPPRPQTEAIYRQIGAAIAKLRRDRGWTQERLASVMGVQPNYLARIETAARFATVDTLVAAADALGVSFLSLVAQPGEPAGQVEFPPKMVGAARSLDPADIDLLAGIAETIAEHRRHVAVAETRAAYGTTKKKPRRSSGK